MLQENIANKTVFTVDLISTPLPIGHSSSWVHNTVPSFCRTASTGARYFEVVQPMSMAMHRGA